MPKNANNGEDHPRKVAIRISDEDLGRVPVVPPKRHRHGNEGQQQIDGEEMWIGGRMWIGYCWCAVQRQSIVHEEKDSNNERLRNLNAIDTGEDVDAVGAKNGHSGHVSVVDPAQVDQGTEIMLKLERHHDIGDSIVDKVDDEHGDGGNGRDEELVSPTDVEEIISDA